MRSTTLRSRQSDFSYPAWLLLFRNPEQQQTGYASGTFRVMLKSLHFVERLCVTDVGDVEPF
ncbi:MAG: hypothetical protein AUH15_04400 [Acidobacteriales bacterium 13_2_20CM_55_8]|nr:MAG: hypothetical protein AUH15_04400 [Acidobacteriales bacterium 13_2_20CM_55_8]